LTSRFVILDVDAGWSSSQDATNNASVSAKPGIAFSRVSQCSVVLPDGSTSNAPCTLGPWLHAFGDLRARFGEFADDSAGVEHINQAILGAGVQFRMTSFPGFYRSVLRDLGAETGREDEVPSLTLTYYHVVDNATTAAAIPEDVTADVLQAVARADLTLPLFCTTREVPAGRVEPAGREYSCPLGIQTKITGTLPTSRGLGSELFYDFGLYLNSDGKIKPVVRLRSGEEHGLEYDQQLIIGLLWELGS
jgi:hypothetical protein